MSTRPVPINTELVIRFRLVREHRRRLYVDGELLRGGETLAETQATFVHVALEHFLATPEGQAAAERWRATQAQ